MLLGVPDQNLPVSQEKRNSRMNSIQKMMSLINIAKRLRPELPRQLFSLDPEDPEFQDKMYYPTINHTKFIGGVFFLGVQTAFFAYNWSTIMGNSRLKLLKFVMPVSTFAISSVMFNDYYKNMAKIHLFDNYV